MILVDTSVIIDFINGKENAIEKIGYYKGQIAISSITTAEVGIGFELKKQNKNKNIWNRLLSSEFKTFPVTNEIAKTYSKLQAKSLKTSGQLSGFDGLIAATALVHNLSLLTFDSGFKRVPGLKFI